MVEDVLKHAYMQRMSGKMGNEEFARIFRMFGFETSCVEVLSYEDPWHVRFMRWFTD